MTKLSKIIAGKKAKRVGENFENHLHGEALRGSWQVIKMPMGARMVTAHKMIRVRTDFDFVFAKKFPLLIFADAKCMSSKNFQSSQVTTHQVDAIFKLHQKGFKAGYIVNFSTQNITVWFNGLQLYTLAKGESLKPEEGIYLGNSTRIDLDMIFQAAPNHITSQVADV